MAYDVKKTDHLFVPFDRFGHALRDSKGNSKIYKDMRTLEQHNRKDDGKPAWLASLEFYVDFMEYAPVVRCKDCKWRKQSKHCYMISGCGEPVGTGDDFFCQYGERRTDV